MVFDYSLRVIDDTSRHTALSKVDNTVLNPEVVRAISSRQNVTNLRRDEAALYVAVPVIDDRAGRVGAVLLVVSVEDIFQSLAGVQETFLMYSLLFGFTVIIVVFFSSNRLIVPLKRILRVVQKMTTGQFNQRITMQGHGEYAQLARAFNNMTEKLEQVEKTREEFVSNVSHELKTPLTAIKVLSESMLAQESVPEEMYREFLQDINSEVDRMTMINNDLLELVKIDQRERGLNIQPTSINDMVEDILNRLLPLADQKEIPLIYEDVRPVKIDADEMKLSLAISNIVENAIKYTPRQGTVRVVVDADHQFAYITVQDTGIGIVEEEQSKIFTRFYRVDKTRDRETGGTGLGLSITHSTVLLHNGTVRVSSKINEGSTFTVRIPIRRS